MISTRERAYLLRGFDDKPSSIAHCATRLRIVAARFRAYVIDNPTDYAEPQLVLDDLETLYSTLAQWWRL